MCAITYFGENEDLADGELPLERFFRRVFYEAIDVIWSRGESLREECTHTVRTTQLLYYTSVYWMSAESITPVITLRVKVLASLWVGMGEAGCMAHVVATEHDVRGGLVADVVLIEHTPAASRIAAKEIW